MSFVQDILKKGWKLSWSWKFGGLPGNEGKKETAGIPGKEVKKPKSREKRDPQDFQGPMG